MNTVENDSPSERYPCPKCGRRFNKQQTLDRHLSRKFPCDKPRDLSCPKCHKTFEKHRDLHRHNNRKNPCIYETPTGEVPNAPATVVPLTLEEENEILKKELAVLRAKLNALKEIILQ